MHIYKTKFSIKNKNSLLIMVMWDKNNMNLRKKQSFDFFFMLQILNILGKHDSLLINLLKGDYD